MGFSHFGPGKARIWLKSGLKISEKHTQKPHRGRQDEAQICLKLPASVFCAIDECGGLQQLRGGTVVAGSIDGGGCGGCGGFLN